MCLLKVCLRSQHRIGRLIVGGTCAVACMERRYILLVYSKHARSKERVRKLSVVVRCCYFETWSEFGYYTRLTVVYIVSKRVVLGAERYWMCYRGRLLVYYLPRFAAFLCLALTHRHSVGRKNYFFLEYMQWSCELFPAVDSSCLFVSVSMETQYIVMKQFQSATM